MTMDNDHNQNAANAEMEIAFEEGFQTDPEFAAAASAMRDEYPDDEDEDDAPMTPSEERAFMMLFRRVRIDRRRFPVLNEAIDLSLIVRESCEPFGTAFNHAWCLHFIGASDFEPSQLN